MLWDEAKAKEVVFDMVADYTHNRRMLHKTNTGERLSVLSQICKLVPPHVVAKTLRSLAEEHKIKIQTCVFSVWSHIVSLIYCHVAHCLSINGICDSLGLHCALLNSIRNATAPRRNTLAHANKTRSSEAIKAVYYAIPAHCHTVHPAFCARGHRCHFRFPRRLKRAVRAIGSTTIEWQLWSAMIAYLLLRLHAWLCAGKRDFRHFFTLVKGALWCRRPLEGIVSQYGTAGKRKRVDLCPTIPYLTGLDWSRVD